MSETGRKTKILVIDDEALILKMMPLLLSQSGYDVDTAGSARDGVSKARELNPDIILLDIFMPGMDGVEVCKIIRDAQETRHIPIICITGNASQELKLRCFEAGANDFLAKPIDPVELKARIQNFLLFKQYSEALAQKTILEKSWSQIDKATREWEETFDSLDDLITIHDREFNILRANRKAKQVLGIDPEKTRNIKCYVHFHNMACPHQLCPSHECISNKTAATSEFFEAHLGMFVEIRVIPRTDNAGNVTGYVHVVHDITKRKATQDALEKAYEELHDLFRTVATGKKEWESSLDAIRDMIVVLDHANNIKRCNRIFTEFTAKKYEALLGQPWTSITKELSLFANDRLVDGVETYHEASKRHFQLSYSPFKYVDESEGKVIIIHDVTEIKNVTKALRETNLEIETSRAQLESALKEITHLIEQVTLKKDFTVRFSNPNVKKCNEIMRCVRTNCPCYDVPGTRCWQIAGTYCGGKIQGAFTDKFGNCSQCPTFKSATLDPIYQIGESFNNMMHILDIQHRELETAYNDLKTVQSQVIQQEKMASIGQLAAGVAHEINNPTGFIMSNLGSLQKYTDKLTEFIRIGDRAMSDLPAERSVDIAKQRKALKIDYILEDIQNLVKESLDGAERIKKIVQDLKSFSRLDEMEQKMADINKGMESTINIVWNELKYKATVKKEYGDIPQTKCNPGQLNQVFMNMLVNAAHAIETKGEIVLRTWVDSGNINVSISDTGSGIPQDKISRIFEPFYTTKEVGKGTGLGLSIAYDIVKKHNGVIDVASEVGKGTTFTIKIPIVGE